MSNLLYIGDPSSIHDLKWAGYFSARPDFNVFFIGQAEDVESMTDKELNQLRLINVTLEEPIYSYSLWRWWENLKSINTIKDVIKRRKIDLLHILFATPSAIWARYVNVPTVLTTRGSDVMVVLPALLEQNGLRYLHGRVLFWQFQQAFLSVDALTCTSQRQLTQSQKLFGGDLTGQVIRTGVNVDEIDAVSEKVSLPDSFADRKVIFLPRYIQPIYRTELQLKALAALPEVVKEGIALLLVNGKKENEQYLAELHPLLDGCGVPYHIESTYTQHQMWALFKQSAVAIMTPSTDGTPNSALEAMAAKCPLILGAFDYDNDLFSSDLCLRMRSDEPKELAQLIETALTDYPKDMLENAFSNAQKKGNRPVEMERLLHIYQSLTSQ